MKSDLMIQFKPSSSKFYPRNLDLDVTVQRVQRSSGQRDISGATTGDESQTKGTRGARVNRDLPLITT